MNSPFLGENKRKLSRTDIYLRAMLNKKKLQIERAHFNKMEQTPVGQRAYVQHM